MTPDTEARPVEPRTEVEALAVDLGQTHDHEIGIHDRFERVFAAQAAALRDRGWRRESEVRDELRERVAGLPRLRLTGEQLNDIDPDPEQRFYVDWDEYDEFVRLDAVRDLLSESQS